MRQQIELKTLPRPERGKGPARRLRARGRCPGVVYGGGQEPQTVSVETHDFEHLLNHGLSSSSLVNLHIEGESGGQLVILREIHRDPVKNKLEHIDFLRVRLDQEVEYEIPVHSLGSSPGVRAGGILEHATRTVHVRCLPTQAPEALEVPIDDLDFGHSIHVSDLTPPEGVTFITDPHAVLFSVVAPRVVAAAAEVAEAAEGEEVAEEAAEEEGEPEVIGKGKREEEAED